VILGAATRGPVTSLLGLDLVPDQRRRIGAGISSRRECRSLLRTCGSPIPAWRAFLAFAVGSTRAAISRLPSAAGGRIKSAAGAIEPLRSSSPRAVEPDEA